MGMVIDGVEPSIVALGIIHAFAELNTFMHIRCAKKKNYKLCAFVSAALLDEKFMSSAARADVRM